MNCVQCVLSWWHKLTKTNQSFDVWEGVVEEVVLSSDSLPSLLLSPSPLSLSPCLPPSLTDYLSLSLSLSLSHIHACTPTPLKCVFKSLPISSPFLSSPPSTVSPSTLNDWSSLSEENFMYTNEVYTFLPCIKWASEVLLWEQQARTVASIQMCLVWC